MKAKFIMKYYEGIQTRDFLYLIYEYRGITYTVYQCLYKYGESLASQHKKEQGKIDDYLKAQKSQKNNNFIFKTADESLSEFFKNLDEI